MKPEVLPQRAAARRQKNRKRNEKENSVALYCDFLLYSC